MEVHNIKTTSEKTIQGDTSDDYLWKLPISSDSLSKLQQEDEFCKNILSQIEKVNIVEGQLYIIKDHILKRICCGWRRYL